MQVVLRQSFSVGRFHATPWRANSFDDPHGEWPPSPFRLLRAIVARFYQAEREIGLLRESLELLIRALATSTVRFYLPPLAERGPALRQYQPGLTLAWDPPGAKDQKKGATKSAKRSLSQDNSFAVPAGQALYWFFDGPNWSESCLSLLDVCLARMTYFGRAESITEIARLTEPPDGEIQANCELTERRQRDTVPVLCLTHDLDRAIVEASTDSTALKTTTLPPGTAWRYARRPQRPPQQVARPVRSREPTCLMQFALGRTVDPPVSAIATMTGWFRGRVLRQALAVICGGKPVQWKDASAQQRAALSGLTGKDEAGHPLEGHEHARYLMWREGDNLTRLMVFRSYPFEAWEYDAILSAAEKPLGWTPARGNGWSVQMVPLDAAVPSPPGFNAKTYRHWLSVTPFVLPRFHLDSRGRPKKGEGIAEQVAKELSEQGRPEARIDVVGDADWVRVHEPHSNPRGKHNNTRRSFWLRIAFNEPVTGPIMLGHSSHFGLGLFRPDPSQENT